MTSEKTLHTLNESGLRATGSRAIILEIIRQGQGHLDADEIYRRARARLPRLSLSTVYRNLQRFKEQGLVEEFHFDENHHHYEAKPSAEHHHLICQSCGKVIEFDYPLSRHIIKNVPAARGFKVAKSELHLSGYCPQCQQESQAAEG